MKILMLCEFYNETLEYQENLLVKYYKKHGHDVTVITSTYESVFDYYNNIHDNKKPKKVYYDHGAKIIKLPFKFNILGKIKKYINITPIVEEFKPDLLYVHDIMPNMLEMLDYKKKNPHVKMIMDYHADYTNSGNNWASINILHKIIRKKMYMDPVRDYVSKFFPIIPGSKTFLKDLYGIKEEQMEILPLGADIDLVEEIKKSNKRTEIRKKFGITDNQKLLYTGGKFTPLKRIDILLEAFNEMNNPDLHLVVVGDSDANNLKYKEKLLAIAANNKNIHFSGWVNNREVYEYLSASDLAVFPASQSIVWLQAIASELPLIIGDFGGQSLDYINEFGAIIEMKPNEITKENLKKHIKSVVSNHEEYSKMKEASKKTRDKYLDWNHLIENTLKFNT